MTFHRLHRLRLRRVCALLLRMKRLRARSRVRLQQMLRHVLLCSRLLSTASSHLRRAERTCGGVEVVRGCGWGSSGNRQGIVTLRSDALHPMTFHRLHRLRLRRVCALLLRMKRLRARSRVRLQQMLRHVLLCSRLLSTASSHLRRAEHTCGGGGWVCMGEVVGGCGWGSSGNRHGIVRESSVRKSSVWESSRNRERNVTEWSRKR